MIKYIGNCLYCGNEYHAHRKTKKYCSDKCRVYDNRVPQNSKSSPTKRRENMEYFDRADYALELYRECGSNYREEWLQDYIDHPTTKKILCNPKLLRADGLNIAKIAHRFTMQKYGVSIKDYYAA